MTFDEFRRRILTAAAEERLLPSWIVLPTVDSSNSWAKRLLEKAAERGEEPRRTVVVAWEQTAGRGRQLHRWNSPAGLGVYTSLLLPEVGRPRLPLLPLLTAVGLARGVGRHLDAASDARTIGLRWPNDLMVAGRKIGGILIEVVTTGAGEPAVVIGYGVNHGQAVENLPHPEATSIALEAAAPPELPELVVELARCVAEELERTEDPGYAVDRFGELLVHRPGDRMSCRTADGVLEGDFDGIDPRGFLRLKVDGEVRILSAGEVMDSTERDDDDSGSAGADSDHSYFRAIEEVFIRLRGAPFLLSPEDWRVAARWRRDGIPLEVVNGVLVRIFAEREAASGEGRSISGLRYFNRPVRAAWAHREAVLGPESSRDAEPLDVQARLEALAGAVADIAELDGIRLGDRIVALGGGPTEEVESRLAELDGELLSGVKESLSIAERQRLEAGVEAGLDRIRAPMSPAEEAEIRLRLERQVLRRMRSLPLLSLFSPAAE